MIRYDPTRTALLHPEQQPTLFVAGRSWPVDAVCAECSRLAYVRFEADAGRKAVLTEAIARAGLAEPGFFSDGGTGTQAFAAIDAARGRAFVAFRGTEPDEPSDWVTDAQAMLVDWQGTGKIHLGYRDALNGAWGRIEAWLTQAPGLEVWITGHSLGAALATLASALLPAARLVSFGSPRVGNAAFAAQFEGRSVRRYVNCCDLVPRLPPALLGYAHVQGLAYIDRHGRVCPDASEAVIDDDVAAARSDYLVRESWRIGNVGLRDLADHSAVNYVSGVLQDRAEPEAASSAAGADG